MSLARTSAILLRKRDYSETSLVTIFFTKDFGKLHFLIKGAKKKSRSYGASFEHGTCYELLFLHRPDFKGLSLLREAHLQQNFNSSHQTLDQLYRIAYILELLDQFSELEDPHPDLFDATLEILQSISKNQNLDLNVRFFEWTLLKTFGLWASLLACPSCKKSFKDKIFLNSAKGQLFCLECSQTSRNWGESFEVQTLNACMYLEKKDFQNIPIEQHSELCRLFWFYIDFHLEKPLKSRKFLLPV